MASSDAPAVFCAAHPTVETALRCGRCDVPICPRCLVQTPVGARCASCARLRPHPLYEVHPRHYLRAAAVGLGVALAGGLVVPFIPFFTLFAILFLGWLTGEAVSVAANRKRGRGLALVAAAATVLGALGGPALLAVATAPGALPWSARLALGLAATTAPLLSLWGVFIFLAAVLAASRLR